MSKAYINIEVNDDTGEVSFNMKGEDEAYEVANDIMHSIIKEQGYTDVGHSGFNKSLH